MPNTVLLIDDAESIHAIVRAHLAADGVEVFSAYDALAGIEAARRLRPDLVLLDVELPDMNGFEVCELLTVQSETAGIPVMFLSALAEPSERVRGLQCGATDFVAKPFLGEELRARVQVSMRYKAMLEMESRRALRDGLTGLWNRKYFDERLAAEISGAARHEHPLSCVMIDLDHFKQLNDTHGHIAGDSAIRKAAEIFEQGRRVEDIACRYGGEEFVVLCPGVGAGGAATLAERLRVRLAAARIDGPQGQFSVTCSLGVADMIKGDLLPAADAALYRAKRAGRNRVVVASDRDDVRAA